MTHSQLESSWPREHAATKKLARLRRGRRKVRDALFAVVEGDGELSVLGAQDGPEAELFVADGRTLGGNDRWTNR